MIRKLILATALVLIPVVSQALQLHWASGSNTLSFTAASRCTLIVEAGNGEVALPGEWRLAWTVQNSGPPSIVIDTTYTDTLTAQVALADYTSQAERSARVKTAEFQGKTNTFVTSARYIFDLPAGSAGKFQAIAARVSDEHPNGILVRSPIASFNGGTNAPFPPTIVTATGLHPTNQLTVEVVGTGLASTAAADLVAPDASWSIPLDIVAATDSSLSVSGDTPTDLPASVLQLRSSAGTSSATSLAATTCAQYGAIEFAKFNSAVYVDPNPGVSTKDFAFFYNHGVTTPGLFHLMYIRHVEVPAAAETTLAHAWSTDLAHWTVDTTAFLYGTRAFPSDLTRWDHDNVWAPTIIKGNGSSDTTFMFYTGVDRSQNQSIGYATTTDLNTCDTQWDRHDSPAWTVFSSPWMARRTANGRNCRDPYIFQHPDSAGVYFMVYAALDSASASPSSVGQAVGVARNQTRFLLNRWLHVGHYKSSLSTNNGGIGQVEGPIVFPDRSSPPSWALMFSNAAADSGNKTAVFERQPTGSAGWDTTFTADSTTGWSAPATRLWTKVGGGASDSTVFGWQGTEYLRGPNNTDYLAGFASFGVTHVFSGNPNYTNGAHNVQGIAIGKLNWTGHSFALSPGTVSVINTEGNPAGEVTMSCVEFRPRSNRVSWRITVPTAMQVKFTLYDVLGRSERTLMDRLVRGGPTIVTWDTAANDGSLVRSGMYYARLTFEGGARVTAVPIVR